MMRNIFTKTLYQKRMSMFWWSLGIALMSIMTLAFYPTLKQVGLDQSFGALPESLQKLTGGALSFQTLGAYIDQQIFALRLPMLTIIMAVIFGVGLTVGDEQRGLVESQLALPISRTKLLLHKIGALTVILAVASTAVFIVVLVSALVMGGEYSVASIGKSSFALLWLSLVFGMIAVFIASLTGKKGLTIGIASAIAFTGYLISSLGIMIDSLDTVERFSPFHYYQVGDGLTFGGIAVLIVTSAVLAVLSIVSFARRDIKV